MNWFKTTAPWTSGGIATTMNVPRVSLEFPKGKGLVDSIMRFVQGTFWGQRIFRR